MFEKVKYSGALCGSGLLVSFSGINLSLDHKYKIKFDNVNTIPSTTRVTLNPSEYFLTPSDTSPLLSTIFTSNSNISDNSSINIISLSVFDSGNALIYKDYKSIVCENLCGSGVPLPPPPSVTPTLTPTVTPTTTPTPSPRPQPPLLSIRAAFNQTINTVPSCSNVLVAAKAYGIIGNTYSYSFGTDMTGVNLNISNPSGKITILQNPTYVYTNITLPEVCKAYYLEFGLSDSVYTVQSAAIFKCGDC